MNWNYQKTVHEIQWNSSYFFISVIVNGYCCIDKVCAIWTCAMSAGHCALQIILSAGASQITTTTFAATSHHFQKIFRGYWKVSGNWRKTFFINPPSLTLRLHLTVPLFPNTNLIINLIAVITSFQFTDDLCHLHFTQMIFVTCTLHLKQNVSLEWN